jgi:DNA-binding PadR family transcriptional regulator
MAKEKADLVYGTLDMLILKALQPDPRHGLAIADRIQQMSQDITSRARVTLSGAVSFGGAKMD